MTDLTPPAVDERISEVAVHSIVETGGTYPARPTGAEVAVFIGSTNPSGAMQSSDFWVPLDGDAQLLDETAAADLINSQAGALYEAVKGVTTTPQVFIPASRFRTVGGTATDTSIGAANEDKVSVLTLPGSVDTYIGCTLDIPPYMSSFQAIVVWSLGGSSSGAVVRWRISTNVLSHGVTFDARTIVGSDNGTTAGQYVVQRTNVGGPTACVPGETRRFTVARLGSSEATYGTALAGNAGFIGLLLVEAS